MTDTLDEVRLGHVKNGGQVPTLVDAAVASICPRQLFVVDQVAVATVLLPTSRAAVVVGYKEMEIYFTLDQSKPNNPF